MAQSSVNGIVQNDLHLHCFKSSVALRVVIGGCISAMGKTSLVFIDSSVSLNQNTYREILEQHYFPTSGQFAAPTGRSSRMVLRVTRPLSG